MTGLRTSYHSKRVVPFCAQKVILIKTLAETFGQAQTKTYCDLLSDANIEAIIHTLGRRGNRDTRKILG